MMKGHDALTDFLDGMLKNDDYFPQDHTEEENIEHYGKIFEMMLEVEFSRNKMPPQ